jgi:hypothetical protein
MDENPTYSWLDLSAHDHMIDTQFIEADKYDDFMRFIHDDEGEPKDIQPPS